MKKTSPLILVIVLILIATGHGAVVPAQAQDWITVDPSTRTVENGYVKVSWDLEVAEKVTGLYFKEYDPDYNLNGDHVWEWTGNAYYYNTLSTTINIVSVSIKNSTWNYIIDDGRATINISSVSGGGIPVSTQYVITADSPAIFVSRTFGFGSTPIEAIRLAPYALLAYPISYFTTFAYPRTDGTIASTTEYCGGGCPKYDWDETWIDIEAPSWDVGLGLVNLLSNPSTYAWLDRYGYSNTSYVYAAIPGPTFDENLTVSYVLYPHLGDYTAVDWDSVIPSYPADIKHLEVTQAVQDQTNTVPLIADKPTFVRVYLSCGTECTGEPVTGLLRGYGSSGELPGSPVLSINDSVIPRNELWTSQRGDLDKTLNYTVPPAWTSGEITLVAEVEGTSFSQPVTFLQARDVQVSYVPVRYEGQEPTDRIDTAFVWAERNWPTANVDYQPIPTMSWSPPFWCTFELGGIPYMNYAECFHKSLMFALTNAARRAGVESYVFGWLPEDAKICYGNTCLLGGAPIPTTPVYQAAWAIEAEGEEGHLRFAHEAGHLLGRGHTVAPGDPLGRCANPDPTGSDWPYSDTAKIEQWGLDGSWFDWLFQSASALKSPDDTYDYMSYCWSTDYAAQPAWTSAWNYSHLYSETLRIDGLGDVTTALSDSEPYLIVSGFVFTDSTAILDPVWVVSSTLQPENPPVGSEYCLQAEDDTGILLFDHCFDLSFVEHQTGEATGLEGFNLMVPYPNGVTRVVLKMGSEELAEHLVSAHAPEVTVLSPNGEESWPATGTASISWSSSDADGDPLTYSVSYSPDGTDWVPVGGTITETQVTVDAGELAGGNGARVRVMVTDGINTSTDESDAAFEVGRKAPTAYILSPDASADVRLGTPVLLGGYAYDPEDSVLDDSALHWTSSRDGDLGMGSQLLVTLSQGKHVVTFTATDSDGSNSSDQVLVSVGIYRIYLPVVTRAH